MFTLLIIFLRQSLFITCSGLYAFLLIVICLAFLTSEVVTDNRWDRHLTDNRYFILRSALWPTKLSSPDNVWEMKHMKYWSWFSWLLMTLVSLMFTQPGPLVESKHFIFTQPAPLLRGLLLLPVPALNLLPLLCLLLWANPYTHPDPNTFHDLKWHLTYYIPQPSLLSSDLLHESTCCRGPPEPATYFQVFDFLSINRK